MIYCDRVVRASWMLQSQKQSQKCASCEVLGLIYECRPPVPLTGVMTAIQRTRLPFKPLQRTCDGHICVTDTALANHQTDYVRQFESVPCNTFIELTGQEAKSTPLLNSCHPSCLRVLDSWNAGGCRHLGWYAHVLPTYCATCGRAPYLSKPEQMPLSLIPWGWHPSVYCSAAAALAAPDCVIKQTTRWHHQHQL